MPGAANTLPALEAQAEIFGCWIGQRHDLETCQISRAAPAVWVPERFRMKHALPLRWMRVIRAPLFSRPDSLAVQEPERSWEVAPSVEPCLPVRVAALSPAKPWCDTR